ncbi:helix-hairpin-helix domain-containing protein [Streptomyces sp. B6B3]|uniref:helix-hairpin-helix domain-containing protein n=1 Tax=Streptomyces sp. B6B3 TaxID=3153570 RepID=UPI00325F2FC7
MQTRTRRSGAGRGPGSRGGTGPGRHPTRARRAPTPLTGWRILPRAPSAPPPSRPSWAEAPPAAAPATAHPARSPDGLRDTAVPPSWAAAPPVGTAPLTPPEAAPPRAAPHRPPSWVRAADPESADLPPAADAHLPGPPQARATPGTGRGDPPVRVVRPAPPKAGEPADPAGDDPAPPLSPLSPARRLRLALVDRLPDWAGPRCGMEPRTLAALALLLLVAVGFGVHHFWTGRPQPVSLAEPATATASPTSTSTSTSAFTSDEVLALPSASPTGDGSVVVDVSGDVRDPGVYTLPAGSRVADALAAAGGAEPGADTETLNRARLLVDGEQIVVGAPAAGPVPAPPGTTEATSPVSLNAATAEQLEQLPGIGPVLAANIIDYREQSGGFTTVEELLDVSGIGESRLAELRDHVTP